MNIDNFISFEKLRGIKETETLKSRLKPLFAFLHERNLEAAETRPKDIQEFQTWLSTLINEDGSMRYAAYTVRSIISAGRRYFNYLKDKGITATNPFLHIKQIKPERKLPHDIPNEMKMDELLEELRTFWKREHLRDRRLYYRCHVMAELMYASGLRISEVLALKEEDINFESNTVTVLKGKGGRTRTAYLTDYAAKVLRFYLEEMRETVIVNRDSALLFGVSDKSTITTTLHKVLKEAGQPAGINHFTSHSFRHTLGYHLLKRGCDLRYIQLILGHEDMNTTTIYTKVTKEDLKNQLDCYHPRNLREKKAG